MATTGALIAAPTGDRVSTISPQAVPAATTSSNRRLSLSARAWAWYQGGRDPWVIVVGIYIFMPYFATTVVGDPVRGQALVAGASKISGWTVALTAPLIGLILDKTGRRMPWLIGASLLMVPLVASLWWAQPGPAGLTIDTVLWLHICTAVLFGYTEVLHNSTLISAAGAGNAHRASALGIGLGNIYAFVLLLFVLLAFALPGTMPGLPAEPLFGIDRATFEPQRVVGPIVAVLLLLATIPMALYTRDAPPTRVSLGTAVRASFADLRALLARLPKRRDAAWFLLARMFYADGLLALLAFVGIYAAGVMGWGAVELTAMGLLFTGFAAAGGLLASRWDSWVGPRHAVMAEIGLALVALLFLLGIGPTTLLYTWEIGSDAVWASPFFGSAPEVAFLAAGCVMAIGVAGSYASSRTLLTRLVPEDELGAYFGLYGLCGTATAWLGPALVEYTTRAFASQRAGFVPIAGLLLLGLILLLFVRGGRAFEVQARAVGS